MKKLALAAALSLVATGALAGSMAAPVMEAEPVATNTGSSGGGVVLPLIALLVLWAALM